MLPYPSFSLQLAVWLTFPREIAFIVTGCNEIFYLA